MQRRGQVGRSNNFDAMRFWAALLVLWSHAFALSGSTVPEPLTVMTRGQASGGSIAVDIFFVISGYLISRSYDVTSDSILFVRSRVLRIFPALIIVLLILAFVVGPLLSSVSVEDYFRDTAVYKFVLLNLPIYLNTSDHLPGVFTGNPYPDAVNGSLWTLAYEFRCYILVLMLGLTGLLNKWSVLILYLVCIGIASTLHPTPDHQGWTAIVWQSAKFTGPFLAGACLYFWKFDFSAVKAGLAVIAIALGCVIPDLFWLTFVSAGAYLTLHVALSVRARVIYPARFGDLSYGIYIYAFPVQQIVAFYFNFDWLGNALASTPVVLACAAFSWNFIEKPALKLKRPSRPVSLAE